MDRPTAIRAAVAQTLGVLVLSLALGLSLPHSFFEDWGWLAGPGAWAICALLTARVVALPTGAVLLGAALAGIPSLAAVLIGVHWLGAVVAIGLLAAWCGRLAARAAATGGGPAAAAHP